MASEKQNRIAQRAYAIWQAEGQPDGRHEEHWHRAAGEIEWRIEAQREAHNAGENATLGRLLLKQLRVFSDLIQRINLTRQRQQLM